MKDNKAIISATMDHDPLPLLTKTQEMDWIDVFETKKAEAVNLKSKKKQNRWRD